jgi:GT2 family glycosyltransferase
MSAGVAVAVVSWNTRELLRRCLESLAVDAETGLAEVWVVDNGSGDGSPEMVADRFGWATLLAGDENLGFGRAVNLVADRTDSPWLVAANADVRIEPGALRRLLDAGQAAPRLGIVAPRLMTPTGSQQHSVHSFPTVTLQALTGLGIHNLVPAVGDRLCVEGAWDPERGREVDWAHGALLLIRRASFAAVGGFDPEQWMYAEDLDLAWRMRRQGWLVRYEPAAVVQHEVSAATARAFGDDRRRRYMAATYSWMARRRGLAVTRAFAVVSIAAAVLRWLALAPLAAIDRKRFGPGRDTARGWARAHRIGLGPRRSLLDGPDSGSVPK